MEPTGHARQKTRIPRCTSGSRPGVSGAGLAQGLSVRSSERDRGGQKKMVTMAPRSRYLTGKSAYVARKPLFAGNSHISILKKAPLQEHSEQEVVPEQGCSFLDQHWDMGCRSTLLAEETSDSDACAANAPSLSTSGEDLSMPLSTLDLRSWSSNEDSSLLAGFQANLLSRRCLSSPSLDVHSVTVQGTPKWNSTLKSSALQHSSSSSSHFSRRTRAEHSLVQSGDTSLNPRPAHADSKPRPLACHKTSPFQVNYWACTIPSSLLPSSDRKSPSWDPDREYETLLDYTYPLRPNRLPVLDSTDTGSLLQTVPRLLDSGIELDRFCSSSSLNCSDQPLGERRRGLSSTGQVSPTPREHLYTNRCGSRLFGSCSSVDQKGLSVESLLETDRKRAHCWTRGEKRGVSSSGDPAPHFIRTSRVLPARRLVWDSDEEYRALPGQLQELQELSQHLQALSAQVCKPDYNSSPSPESETSFVRISATSVENKSGEERLGEGGKEPFSGSPCNQEGSVEVESLEAGLPSAESLGEVQTGMATSQENFDTKESLMQHIQEFCSNLEQLIIWLYNVVEKMERLTPPTVEIESVKSSLADYQSFQRELSSQQPLTTAVLHKGGVLLRSLDSASPVLKETLRQIEKQSRALEAHGEHLFSSILSAMDSLTETEVQGSGLSSQLQDLKESWLTEQDGAAAGQTCPLENTVLPHSSLTPCLIPSS